MSAADKVELYKSGMMQFAQQDFSGAIELFNRGYSKYEIKKIWGENFLRVFREVEKYSKEWKRKNAG